MNVFGFAQQDTRKLNAWIKATPVNGYDPAYWRRDRFGKLIYWDEYGKCALYGWEIDHVWPLSRGGSSQMANELATHWTMNRKKSNKFIG